jgi:hypothetical protein
MECTGKAGFAVFDLLQQGESDAWRSRKRLSRRKLQLGGSQGCGLGVYSPQKTESKMEIPVKNALIILLAASMVLPVQGGQQASPAIEKQVGQIPKGSVVVVTTNLRKMKKVRGRLGEVTAEGFAVDNVKLRFADVTSINEKLQHKKTSPWVWVLAIVGGAALVIVIIGAVVATHGPL